MSYDVANFGPIRGQEIISHTHTTENQHSGRCCSVSSACKNDKKKYIGPVVSKFPAAKDDIPINTTQIMVDIVEKIDPKCLTKSI